MQSQPAEHTPPSEDQEQLSGEGAEDGSDGRLEVLPGPAEFKSLLIDRYLQPNHHLPKAWLSTKLTHWVEDPLLNLIENDSIPDLLHASSSSLNINLEFILAGLEGKVVGCREVLQLSGSQLNARTSTSMDRAPGDYSKDFVRGSSGNVPFIPSALKDDQTDEIEALRLAEEFERGLENTRGGIRTIPPGFTRGLDFGNLVEDSDILAEEAHGPKDTITGAILREPIYAPLSASSRKSGQKSHHKDDSIPRNELDVELDALLADSDLSPRIVFPSTIERCRPAIAKRDWAHVVDVNRGLTNFKELVPVMAKEYPFELDNFQKEAIYHLEMGDSVFIAAHTSAGKTVIAEYAIALAAKHLTRCIYTSPIKALSNQKYRDFKQTFDSENVGILTGDVQVNPQGSCLIMTTEILRSMLYKGADLIRDVEFVVFDEVHYINDSERGVVWEEVIILLPDHVKIILLSATVPNTKEFADWVGRTKKKDIYVISTPKRPVPLEHFLYANKEIFKIVNERGEFLGQGWKDAGEALKRLQVKEREANGAAPLVRMGAAAANRGQRGNAQNRGGRGGGGSSRGKTFAPHRGGASGPNSGRGHQEDQNRWVHLVGMLRKKELLPVVAFTFSKRRCEDNASSLPNTDLTISKEKSEIHIVIERSLTRLSDSDKQLPQILRMRNLLSRGIGVHHGGLLPIVKEMVEILFARGLVKVLFATETFAMGVNMPARSVVFSGIQKHDGQSFRDLLPGEYTQMSGRAGRRGLDSTGVVIILCNEQPPDTPTLHKMLLGQPTKLQSQFRLTYNMILNLLRVEALRVEEMIKGSFSENAQQRLVPDQHKKILEMERQLKGLQVLEDTDENLAIRQYYQASSQVCDLNAQIMNVILGHPSGARSLSSGRLVILNDEHFHGNWGVILKPAKSLRAKQDGRLDETPSFFVLAFVPPHIRSASQDLPAGDVPPLWPPRVDTDSSDLTYELGVIPISSIALITKHTLNVDHNAIADAHRKSRMVEALNNFLKLGLHQDLASIGRDQIVSKYELEYPKLRSLEFNDLMGQRASYLATLISMFDVENVDGFDKRFRLLHQEHQIKRQLAIYRDALSEQNLELLPDYEARIEVLRELKFIDDRATVLLKGRVACEINSSHELILTEIILENVLADYDAAETVALLSMLVFQDKSDHEPVLTPNLERGCAQFQKIADRIETVSLKHKLGSDDNRRGKGPVNIGMVEIVYQWARGMPFSEVVGLSDIQEGTIVRTMTRLDESCREVKDAARIIGYGSLGKKMETCQTLIRRDVIFVSSLYV